MQTDTPTPLAASPPSAPYVRWVDRVFDKTVDEAAREGEKTLVARIVSTILMSGIATVNIGAGHALVWTSLVVTGEALIYLFYKRHFLPTAPASRNARIAYVAACFGLCLVWTIIPWWFWIDPREGLQAASIIILSAQLVHVQGFSFRSMPAAVVTAAPPALSLVLLPWLAGPLAGVERITFTLVAIVGIGYGWASIDAHRKTARLLREAHDELENLAYFDGLTSLANRRQFTVHLRRLIAVSQRRGTRFALLLLDLDQFKTVNDTLGHDAGDAMLIEIGARLQEAIRAEDGVARLGGDEFAILLSNADDKAAIAAVCERIAKICGEVIDINGVSIQSTLSVGVALYPDNGDGQDSLYKSADLALYQAKRSGRNTWRYSKANAEQIARRNPARAATPAPPPPVTQ